MRSDGQIVLDSAVDQYVVTDELQVKEKFPAFAVNQEADCLGRFEFFDPPGSIVDYARNGTFEFQRAPAQHLGSCLTLFR